MKKQKMTAMAAVAVMLCVALLTSCLPTHSGDDSIHGSTTVEDNRSGDDSRNSKSLMEVSVIDNRESSVESSESSEASGEESSADSLKDDDFEVKEYLYENSIGDYEYFLIVTNHSQEAVEMDASVTAYDGQKNAVETEEGEIDVLGPEEQGIIHIYFIEAIDVSSVENTLSYSPSLYFEPIVGMLEVHQEVNDRNVTLIVTNNGESDAQYVQAYALFFDADNQIITTNNMFITNGDGVIRPGETLSAQLDAYQTFDHVECYLIGRSDGTTSGGGSSLSDENFDVIEYKYCDSIGSTLYYLVITNHSEETVEINGNMIAYDREGKTIGAADGTIDVLGPGEQSIATFYFGDAGDVASVDYTLSYETDLYFQPIISSLSMTEAVNEENVVVTVTNNNATTPAEFVDCYALFFDSENNVVAVSESYFTDADFELKPGASLTQQLDAYTTFDHVECYLAGRAD